jgi:hypothetical protein
MLNKGFGECVDCHVWSGIPEGFNETKHFIRCPGCGKPMYLIRGTTSSEVGLSVTKKVIGTLMEHGEEGKWVEGGD